ncbi:MAG: polysaccharide biosynthesis protein [Actinomycetota bacterium]
MAIVARLRRDVPLAVLDLAVALSAYLIALVLRFEGHVPSDYWGSFWRFAPVAALIHVLSNYLFGLYGQMWRYASVREARQILVAGATATTVVLATSEIMGGRERVFPLSVVILGVGLALMGFGAIRFQSRLFAFRRRHVVDEPTRVLVMGAGDAGAMVLRDILLHPEVGLAPVGVIDDDPRKLGRTIHGIPVLGTRARIPELAGGLQADQLLVAIPSATGDVMREVVAVCEAAEVSVRVLPSVREVVNGRVSVRDIRDLSIEDILGRQLVSTDLEAVRSIIEGRRVLITGAGGSIGAEISRQVAEFEPERLIVLDRDEIHLHDLLTVLGPGPEVETALADIRDRRHLFELLGRSRPHLVFHAAAHKHLPMLERHPREAVLTNIVGTRNVAEAAVAAGVERFVLISTDKAVRPSSVLGTSKRVAEQVVWTLQRDGTAFSAVRFGNVLGSRGGVVQTFLRQIALGGPVTVTDPEMARYFMSIQEAVQLVLQAAALARGGEVFTLEMGEPVNIMELARELIRLSGRVPGKDVALSVIGSRPGEKLIEDVVDPDEHPGPSEHPAIMVSRPSLTDAVAVTDAVDRLVAMVDEGRDKDVAARLQDLTSWPSGRPGFVGGIR